VNGVTRAQVTLERKEAVVTYNPRATDTAALIAALNAVKKPFPFVASVKEPAAGASSR
jgi:copper chaperone CopZ